LLLIIGVLLVANISLLWFYVWKKPNKVQTKRQTESPVERLKREIGFNSQQATTYDTLRAEHYRSIRPMFEDLNTSRDSLFKLMHQPMIADSLIASQSEVVYEKQTKAQKRIIKNMRPLIWELIIWRR